MDRFFTVAATRIAGLAGQPAAFIGALSLILVWLVTGPLFGWSDTWQLVVNTATTIVTFLMVFLIQNSQNRDAAAMGPHQSTTLMGSLQAKLDELIRAVGEARNEFIGIEHLTDGEIEAIRRRLEDEVAAYPEGHRRSDSVGRLLGRLSGRMGEGP